MGSYGPLGSGQRPLFRQATVIIPETGEELSRKLTLHDTLDQGIWNARSNSTNGERVDETTALLGSNNDKANPNRFQKAKQYLSKSFWEVVAFWSTPAGKGVLKCSVAYLIATMAVFIPQLDSFLGRTDGKHVVANIVVWFHPARSQGSMHYGTVCAFVAFVYAAILSYGAMAVSSFFESHGMIALGHVIVLIVFCGGGLGFLAWIKQRMGDLLVNVACSLSSMVIATTLTREGAVQLGQFSNEQISQVLKMMILAILISTVINLLIWPVFARRNVRQSLIDSTDAFVDIMTAITSSFLAGSDEDMKHPRVTSADQNFKTLYNSVDQKLTEAKYEQYILGTEKQYEVEKRLVECMQTLSQELGGFRSAAETQFSLLSETNAKVLRSASINLGTTMSPALMEGLEASNRLARPPILERVEEASATSDESDRAYVPGSPSAASPADIFVTFITYLGPPMKSLAFTLKQILDTLPFGPGPKYHVYIHPNYRASLVYAISLFNRKRKEALDAVYKSKETSEAKSIEVAADFEEVAASCGHFSSSLQGVAEHCLTYIDVLEELQHFQHERRHHITRSWNWVRFWRHWRHHFFGWTGDYEPGHHTIHHDEGAFAERMIPSSQKKALTAHLWQRAEKQPFPYWLWPYARVFHREDTRFAIKVGVGATLLAMLSYIPATQAFYWHWRIEWALVSYMFVCAMNVGAATKSSIQRFIGTGIGAVLAVIVWVIGDDNPFILAILSWLVALYCFYLIVANGQGPMGRFILLTYNLSVLYSYSLSVHDDDHGHDDDEGGINPQIWEIVLHRVVSVGIGIVWAIIITRFIWPIRARRKLQNGMSIIWLRMGLIWKHPPLQMLLEQNRNIPSYMDIRIETDLRQFLSLLESLRANAESEFELQGPFPGSAYGVLLACTSRMLDAFHALKVVVTKDHKASPGEEELLRATVAERDDVAKRLCHLLSVLASSIKMEYPLNDALPNIATTRDRLLAKIFEYRKQEGKAVAPTDEDYELLYAYALVTAQIAKEIDVAGREIEKMYGNLNEDALVLQ